MKSRTEALLGAETVERLSRMRVAVIGVGGVGSWCAEALARTGVGHLVLMDDDSVAASNLNRQCPATSRTLGQPKVVAMRERLVEICPQIEVEAVARRFVSEADLDLLGSLDCVVDAIDSVDCKAELILSATARRLPIFSSLGAALRTDPTKVAVRRFDQVAGDALARALRRRFKRLRRFPAARFLCVCSEEQPRACDKAIRGSLMPVTATFGMCLAAQVVNLA